MAYYDGELLIQNLGRVVTRLCDTKLSWSEVAIKIGEAINDTPTADVVEVKHGKWVCLEAEIGYFACSECDHRILRAECNYCPNCGAKMDGGTN